MPSKMKIWPADRLQLQGSIIAIGAFDGVHRGHQAVIRHAVQAARRQKCPSVVYTFDPPPKALFTNAQLLTSIDEKLRRIEAFGPSHAIVAAFDELYAARSATDFLEELAVLNPREVWVGSDFRFGSMGVGDVAMLAERFNVRIADPVCCSEGVIISSSRIRQLPDGCNPFLAEGLLGWFSETSADWDLSQVA